jgi:hypothetical protein
MRAGDSLQSPNITATEYEVGQFNRLKSTRREVLAIGVSSVAILALPRDDAFAQGEAAGVDTATGSEQEENSRPVFADEFRRANNTEEHNDVGQREVTAIEDILGGEYRAPRCAFQSLTADQLIATHTADRPPERGDVGVGAYFSDGHNQKMASTGETPLEAAVRRAAGRLPDGEAASTLGNAAGTRENVVSLGVGATGALGLLLIGPGLYASVGANTGITSKGTAFLQLQGALGIGIGSYVGIGVQGGLSSARTPMELGISFTRGMQIEGNIGLGPSVGGSFQMSGDSVGGQAGIPKLPQRFGEEFAGFGAHLSVGASGTLGLAIPLALPPELIDMPWAP